MPQRLSENIHTLAKPIPENLPQEEAFMEILHQLHKRWRLVICVPLIYLLLGLLISQFYFQPERGGDGFYPLGQEATMAVWMIGGVYVVFLYYLLDRLKKRQGFILSEYGNDPNRFLAKAKESQMAQFFVCDLAAMPGILLFLLNGGLFHLFVFIVISSFFYLYALPNGRILGQAMFHPSQD